MTSEVTHFTANLFLWLALCWPCQNLKRLFTRLDTLLLCPVASEPLGGTTYRHSLWPTPASCEVSTRATPPASATSARAGATLLFLALPLPLLLLLLPSLLIPPLSLLWHSKIVEQQVCSVSE